MLKKPMNVKKVLIISLFVLLLLVILAVALYVYFCSDVLIERNDGKSGIKYEIVSNIPGIDTTVVDRRGYKIFENEGNFYILISSGSNVAADRMKLKKISIAENSINIIVKEKRENLNLTLSVEKWTYMILRLNSMPDSINIKNTNGDIFSQYSNLGYSNEINKFQGDHKRI